MKNKKIIVIGGGAAGFFGAITAASENPEASVAILEKSPRLLTKVRISGGGRCNVTHNCQDPKLLVTNYPRGHKELLGPFYQFQPSDMIQWLKEHRVNVKAEPDGRMFPVTDNSETIINCFMKAADDLNIDILTRTEVIDIKPQENGTFSLTLKDGSDIDADGVLIATGGGPSNKGFEFARSLGHSIVEPVPSLFTFNIDDPRIEDLQGISFQDVIVTIPGTPLKTSGPLLITHWGLSGPAILKLSAWGARDLYNKDYAFEVKINLLPKYTTDSLVTELKSVKESLKHKQIAKNPLFTLPKRFWDNLIHHMGVSEDEKWSNATNVFIQSLAEQLTQLTLQAHGKSTFKEEFVTAGGVPLKEVNFKTLESKCQPGVYFAGEVLDIDGVTGGFNFQAAWTTSFIAGSSM